MGFLRDNWLVLLPVIAGFVAIYFLLPQARQAKPLWAGALAGLALVLGGALLIRTGTSSAESLLFCAFASIAIAAGVMMITQQNPVHAALSFAVVVLSTCGLFLLQAAPFLMAATIIVYAGAIVVTFLFVIMLAQQEGVSNADQRSREPFLASVAGCVLLASLLCVLQKTYDTRTLDLLVAELRAVSDAKDLAEIKQLLGDPAQKEPRDVQCDLVTKLLVRYRQGPVFAQANDLNQAWVTQERTEINKNAAIVLASVEAERQQRGTLALTKVPGKTDNVAPSHFGAGKLPARNVAAIGRTLFTDYLIPVELAATLLLVATIGAIAIAGRKSEELR